MSREHRLQDVQVPTFTCGTERLRPKVKNSRPQPLVVSHPAAAILDEVADSYIAEARHGHLLEPVLDSSLHPPTALLELPDAEVPTTRGGDRAGSKLELVQAALTRRVKY